jgi:hypothetical protein
MSYSHLRITHGGTTGEGTCPLAALLDYAAPRLEGFVRPQDTVVNPQIEAKRQRLEPVRFLRLTLTGPGTRVLFVAV